MAGRYFPAHKLLCSGVSVTSRLLAERAGEQAAPAGRDPLRPGRAQGADARQQRSSGCFGQGLSAGPACAPSPRPARGWPAVWPQPKGCGEQQDGAQHPGWAGTPIPRPGEGQRWHWPGGTGQGTAAVVPGSLGVLVKSPLNPAAWLTATGCWTAGPGQEQHTKCSGSAFLPAQQFVLSSPLCRGWQCVPRLLWSDTLKLCFSGKHEAGWHLLREIPVYSANTPMPMQKHYFLTQEKAVFFLTL